VFILDVILDLVSKMTFIRFSSTEMNNS
jgi:hypothetical protein